MFQTLGEHIKAFSARAARMQSPMDELGNCDRCKRPLIEIDHYGDPLIGCPDCNHWSWRGSIL